MSEQELDRNLDRQRGNSTNCYHPLQITKENELEVFHELELIISIADGKIDEDILEKRSHWTDI